MTLEEFAEDLENIDRSLFLELFIRDSKEIREILLALRYDTGVDDPELQDLFRKLRDLVDLAELRRPDV